MNGWMKTGMRFIAGAVLAAAASDSMAQDRTQNRTQNKNANSPGPSMEVECIRKNDTARAKRVTYFYDGLEIAAQDKNMHGILSSVLTLQADTRRMQMAVTVAGDTTRAAPVVIEGEIAFERSVRTFAREDYTKIPALQGAVGIVMMEADKMCHRSAETEKDVSSWFVENNDVASGVNRAARRIHEYSVTEMNSPEERIRQALKHTR